MDHVFKLVFAAIFIPCGIIPDEMKAGEQRLSIGCHKI